MEILIQIALTGLTLGAMYALASVGLALIWGTLGMFNMAQNMFITVGAYCAYSAIGVLGFPIWLGLPAGLGGGLGRRADPCFDCAANAGPSEL
jgi:branched-subunit amino acid ABC-type transport system permease component